MLAGPLLLTHKMDRDSPPQSVEGPASKPNIAWFITDDQDQELGASFPTHGGVTPMPKTQRLMERQGASASNWYIHTPICSPSRSELLSGKYLHNIKEVGGSSCKGMPGCGYCTGMHVNYSKINNHTFARYLNEEAGYTVGLFGKYLNAMPSFVPPGP
jgi:N-acetylglucosamine-6-sulfatase